VFRYNHLNTARRGSIAVAPILASAVDLFRSISCSGF
jgi:hypothetical protein